MSYCLNSVCKHPQNHGSRDVCQNYEFILRLQHRYVALKPIDQGGFGRTFLALDESEVADTPCVIKQFFPQQQGNNSEHASQLFRQEVLRLQELGKHPQIPELLNYFEQDGYQYLIQEFVDGNNLAQELAIEGAFREPQIRQLLTNLLPVLQFIHEHQVIHRDIKPANMIRCRTDQNLVLVDLGAAKHTMGAALAMTGTVIGSAEYIAPEQARGKAVFASDLYSLGVTCIHLLTELSPFDLFDGSDDRWVWRTLVKHPVSDLLSHVLDKMLQNATNRRYQSANEVLADLNHNQVPETPNALKFLTVISIFTVSFVTLVGLLGRSPSPLPPITVSVAPTPPPSPAPTSSPKTFTVAVATSCPPNRQQVFPHVTDVGEALQYVGSINRAQQAYFLERSKFASNIGELDLGIKAETLGYRYQIASRSPEQVVVTAETKCTGLSSYTGIVMVKKETNEVTTVSFICETEQVSLTPPFIKEHTDPTKEFFQCSPGSREPSSNNTEARQYILTLNRAQQAYYLENSRFSSILADLYVGIRAENKGYRYQVVSQTPWQVVMVAQAKHGGLKSYTGVVVVKNDSANTAMKTVSFICETEQVSTAPPIVQTRLNLTSTFQCPHGSIELIF